MKEEHCIQHHHKIDEGKQLATVSRADRDLFPENVGMHKGDPSLQLLGRFSQLREVEPYTFLDITPYRGGADD
jgi:hypothetical protein